MPYEIEEHILDEIKEKLRIPISEGTEEVLLEAVESLLQEKVDGQVIVDILSKLLIRLTLED